MVVLGIGAGALGLLGRGSIPSLVAGGLVMLGSLILQRFAVAAALRQEGNRAIAFFFLFLKLTLVLALIYVGFNTALLGPMSFAAGATSLPVAIVLDVCYLEWSSRRSRAHST